MRLLMAVAALFITTSAERHFPPAPYTPNPTPSVWHATGSLTEACTCAVPCTCNFGQGPTPKDYCWAVFGFQLKDAEYNGIRLDGLRFAAAHANKGKVLYLDERATPEQRPALEQLARICSRQGAGPDDLSGSARREWAAIVYAPITIEAGPRSNRLDIGTFGGFRADYIMGRDGSRPVVVENNTTWAVERSIKAKTSTFRYKDRWGNSIDLTGTNSNQGDFTYTEKTRL